MFMTYGFKSRHSHQDEISACFCLVSNLVIKKMFILREFYIFHLISSQFRHNLAKEYRLVYIYIILHDENIFLHKCRKIRTEICYSRIDQYNNACYILLFHKCEGII